MLIPCDFCGDPIEFEDNEIFNISNGYICICDKCERNKSEDPTYIVDFGNALDALNRNLGVSAANARNDDLSRWFSEICGNHMMHGEDNIQRLFDHFALESIILEQKSGNKITIRRI